MNHKINEFYPWRNDSKLENQSILCLDHSSLINTHHSGEFLFTSLLLKLQQTYINDQAIKIVLLLANHSRSHYESIFKKNHIDLKLLEQTERICIINLFDNEEDKLFYLDSRATLSNNAPTPICWSWTELQHWQNQDNMSWTSLFPSQETSSSNVKQQQLDSDEEEENKPNNQYALLIDDLEAFELLAPSTSEARKFVSKIYSNLFDLSTHLTILVSYGRLCEELPLQFADMMNTIPSTSGVLLSGHTPLHNHNGQPKLTEYCRYRTDITMIAAPLSTGYSTQVHGIITIYPPIHSHTNSSNNSNNNSNNEQKRKVIVLQYKALDTGITCSPSGDGI